MNYIFSSGTSLQGLARQLLGIELDKSIAIRCGDWESPQLSQEQVSIWLFMSDSTWQCIERNIELKYEPYNCPMISQVVC